MKWNKDTYLIHYQNKGLVKPISRLCEQFYYYMCGKKRIIDEKKEENEDNGQM